MLKIRPAISADITLLSEYWYDNMALLQQSNPRIRLLPDARHQWEGFAKSLVQSSDVIFLCAEVNPEIDARALGAMSNTQMPIGCIAARVLANQAGLAPPQIGLVELLILDLHSPHQQHGTGGELLRSLQAQMAQRQITHLLVSVSAQAAVEQAFWRAMGAKKTDDIFWMTL